jgi:hypothetical protein
MTMQGTPYGRVYPERAPYDGTGEDARTTAMYALRDYICALVFFRAGSVNGGPVSFQIDPAKGFQVEQPDDNKDLVFPSMAVVSGEGEANPTGLTPYLDEASKDVFGKDSILQVHHEHTEVFQLDIWATFRAERRALLAGLQIAFNPTEERAGLLLKLDRYYDQTARFTLLRSAPIDGPDTMKNRRQAVATISLEVNVVQLVHYRTLQPYAVLDVE